MKQHVWILLVILLFFSCEKKFEINSFYDCQDSFTTDAIDLRSELIGFWELKEVSCGLCSGEFPKKADELVVVNFKSDNSFSIQENSVIIDTGDWAILEQDSGAYLSVETENSDYLNGEINVCGNKLYADQTFVDGFGFLYEKTN